MAINRRDGSYGDVKPKPLKQYLKQWFCKHDLKLVGHRKGLSYSTERYPACVRLHNGDTACWIDHNEIDIYECSKCGAKVEKVVSKETKISISSGTIPTGTRNDGLLLNIVTAAIITNS